MTQFLSKAERRAGGPAARAARSVATGGRLELRFYGRLGDFLPADRRQVAFAHELRGRASVKDVIESVGVPHPEVELILADGEPVGFGHQVEGGERIAVYPHFARLPLGQVATAGAPPPRDARFVLDCHLGRLAAYLRLLGFDVLHDHVAEDPALARTAAAEDRILLTRDVGLLKRGIVRHGYFVRETRPRLQVVEVLRRFDLAERVAPFTRCLRCNGLLSAATPAEVAGRVPEGVRRSVREFHLCGGCGRAYWRGSHYARMERLVEAVLAGGGSR